jgi:hypothetical protein
VLPTLDSSARMGGNFSRHFADKFQPDNMNCELNKCLSKNIPARNLRQEN